MQIITDTALNKKLAGVPFIQNPEFIRKYLAPSTATPKEQMKRPRAGLRSNRKQVIRINSTKLGTEFSDSNTEEE